MQKITEIPREGLRQLARYKKAILLAYLANLAAALLLAIPFSRTLERSLGAGLQGRDMVAKLDYEWWQLFSERVSGAASSFSPAVLGVGPFLEHWERLLGGSLAALPVEVLLIAGLYLLLNAFLSGAFLGSLALDPEGTVLREFLRTGGEYFGRFFRMGLLAVLLYLLLQVTLIGPYSSLVEQLQDAAQSDRSALYWSVSSYVFGFPLLLSLALLLDFAKVILARDDRSSVMLAFLSSCTFCLRQSSGVAGLFLILSGIGLVLMLGYVAIEASLSQNSTVGILAALGVQQIYVGARLGMRYWFYASEFCLYRDRR